MLTKKNVQPIVKYNERGINMDFNIVRERPYDGPQFTVTQRLLQIPKDAYFSYMKNDPDPLSEEAVQRFVTDYLRWKDDQGIVGMVRFHENNTDIELEATIRYVTNEPRGALHELNMNSHDLVNHIH